MKKFDIPDIYKSPIISKIKEIRKQADPRKKDFKPTKLDFGPVKFLIARHFGFCYGVENAIEISNRIINENPDKRIFILSEMIHNPTVNEDLSQRGVKFLMDTSGRQLIDWSLLKKEDIVIIPAFGTTLEIMHKLNSAGIDVRNYNTTCPFVEKVWNRSELLGRNEFTVIIHGKYYHEETRATFSHSSINAPSVIIRNMEEAIVLGKIILKEFSTEEFFRYFSGKCSKDFNPEINLDRIGVVNQTTMLATETQQIAEYLRNIMIRKYSEREITEHFADTRDTLCYATNDNQEATYGMLSENADFAVVVGGYNSSNTSHLVELCLEKAPTFFISGSENIVSKNLIRHYDIKTKQEITTLDYFPSKDVVEIMLTSGSSCPDAVVDQVLIKLLSFFENAKEIEEVLNELHTEYN